MHLEEVAGAPDFSVSLGGARLLVASGTNLSLRDHGRVRWSIPIGTGRVVAAASLFDGRAVAIHLENRTGRDLILVIAVRDGAVERRVAVDRARVTFRTGLAVAHIEGERVIVVDLRLGRVIANRAIDATITDITVTPTGAIELHATDGSRNRLELSRFASGTQPPAVVDEPSPPAPIEPNTEIHVALPEPDAFVDRDEGTCPPTPAPDVPSLHQPLAFTYARALPVRSPREPATADDNARILAALRDRARAFAALAIARAWDDGRLAFDSDELPRYSEVIGLLGGVGGLAVDEVETAVDRLVTAMANCATASASIAPRWSPLSILAGELALSPLAQDILIAIAAPQLWRDVARLYAMVDDGCDQHLIAALLGDVADSIAVAGELEPDAPLRKLGLVRELDGLLVVDRVVLRLLRGDSPLGDLAPIIKPRSATRRLDELQLRDETVRTLVRELETAPAPLRIVVRGRDGSGGRSLLAAIVEAAGRTLCVIDAAALVRDPKTCARELGFALQRAHLAGYVPCVDRLDRMPSDDARLREEVRGVLAGHLGPIAFRCARDAQLPLDAHVLVELPSLTPTERHAAWTASLARAGLVDGDAKLLADRYAIGPGTIERIVTTIDPGSDPTAAIDVAVRRHLENRLGTVATRIDRLAAMSQVVLPPDIQDSVTELIARVRHRATVFDAWGFDSVMSTSRGVTALFQGPPGTGKTMVAGAIARELGVELYRVDVSKIMSKWIGETEQNLAKLFDAAEDSHAMLLFDEADSLFAKRTEVKSSVDRYANTETNYLLQRLDTFEGIAVMCTNFGASIDSAFKRRMSFRLTFPFPDDEQRERLWRAHVPANAPIATDIDFAAFARRFQLSGGYIRNCMLRTAFLAAEHGGTVTAELLERAIKAEFREIGKLAQTGALE